jgi:hypothetical protein
MDSKVIAVLAVVLIIIAAGIVVLGGYHTTPTAQINPTANTGKSVTGNQTTNTSKTLFSSTQYYQYAYLIYPGPMSQQAQTALTGFNLTSAVLQNSTAKITLTVAGTNQSQSLMLKTNYKLYVIETTLSDDNFHFDSSLGDDGFVVVDPNGYIVQ